MRWVGFEIRNEYESLRRRYNGGERNPYDASDGTTRDRLLDRLDDLFAEWQMCGGGVLTRQ